MFADLITKLFDNCFETTTTRVRNYFLPFVKISLICGLHLKQLSSVENSSRKLSIEDSLCHRENFEAEKVCFIHSYLFIVV